MIPDNKKGKTMTTITTSRTAAATIEQIKAAFATDPASVAEAAEYCFNCEEASVDEDGDVWIEGPMRGHHLDEDEIEKLVNYMESEVGQSVFDWLGIKGAVAALKVDKISQPAIAKRLGITLSALEKKLLGTNPATLLETKALIEMIAEQAMTTATYTISDMTGEDVKVLPERTMQTTIDQCKGDVCELAESILDDHGFEVWRIELDRVHEDGTWELEGWDGDTHKADVAIRFSPRG